MPRQHAFVIPCSVLALVGAAMGGGVPEAVGQTWQAGTAASNMPATVVGMKMWDPDGAGPTAPVLAALGVFTAAGTTSPANHMATWDGTNWSTFAGTGLVYSGTSGTLATLSSNNNLFFSGTGMTSANGIATKGIAGWDGTSWFGLGTSSVTALVAVASVNADTIVVTGVFTSVNGVAANRVATWNAMTGWAALNDGTNNGISSTGSSVLGLSNGNIVVGGAADFTGVAGGSGAGPLQINRIARWDGAWHTMGSGFTTTDSVAHPPGIPRCLLEMPNGDVIAGGSFVFSGATALNKIARWDRTADVWLPMGTGINNDTGSNHDVYALALMPNGDVVAGGDFTTAGGTSQNYIARWHPGTSTWSGMAPGDVGLGGPVRCLAVLPNGDLAVGGDFLTAGGVSAQRFTIWHEPPVAPPTPPVITVEPTTQFICIEPTAVGSFSLTATGTGLMYQWQQQDLGPTFPDFIDINDGPVTDIFGNLIFIAAGATTNHLVLSDGQGVAQIFRCRVSNTAGHVDSSEVGMLYCHADFDCSGHLEVADIFSFLNSWFGGEARSDFDFDGTIAVQDIFDFLGAWFEGC